MFIFKKIMAQFLFPCSLIAFLLISGLVLLWRGKRPKTGRMLVTAAAALFLLFSYSPFPSFFLCMYENDYRAFSPEAVVGAEIEYVVVLGGGTDNRELPVTSRLGDSSLYRLVEGVRIRRMLGRAKLLVSGGRVFGSAPVARTMADAAAALGVDRSDIHVEPESRDTREQARMISRIVGDRPFVLVTSASHMYRAVRMFRRQGARPVPAPTGHLTGRGGGVSPGMFFPGASNIRKARTAVYETAGIVWAWICGFI